MLVHQLQTEPATNVSDKDQDEARKPRCELCGDAALAGRARGRLAAPSRAADTCGWRGFLLDRIESVGVDPRILVARLKIESAVPARRALIVVLADYKGKGLPASEAMPLKLDVLKIFETNPDSGRALGCGALPTGSGAMRPKSMP